MVGVQKEGCSPAWTKEMALRALKDACGEGRLVRIADVGGGWGELAQRLAPLSAEVWLIDYSPGAGILPHNVQLLPADLNGNWPLPDAHFEFVFSLECIEHVENPRHFMREASRITKPGGWLFVTTPNQESLSSKLTFVLRGQHGSFQEASYPAHIVPLLHCDFERIAAECGLRIQRWYYSNTDTIPRLHWRLKLEGKLFSDTVGVLLQRAA